MRRWGWRGRWRKSRSLSSASPSGGWRRTPSLLTTWLKVISSSKRSSPRHAVSPPATIKCIMSRTYSSSSHHSRRRTPSHCWWSRWTIVIVTSMLGRRRGRHLISMIMLLVLVLHHSWSSSSERLLGRPSSRRWEAIHWTTTATAIHRWNSSSPMRATSSNSGSRRRVRLSTLRPSSSSSCRKSGITTLIIRISWKLSLHDENYVSVGAKICLNRQEQKDSSCLSVFQI